MNARRKRKSNLAEILFISVGALVGILLAFRSNATAELHTNMLIGAAIGAIFWPIARSPDMTSRGIVGGIIAALAIGLFELFRIGFQVQRGTAVETLGAMALTATIRVAIALIVGAIIAIGSAMPAKVLAGAVAGLFVGVIVGGVARIVLASQGIVLSREVYLAMVGLITLVLFTFVRAA